MEKDRKQSSHICEAQLDYAAETNIDLMTKESY